MKHRIEGDEMRVLQKAEARAYSYTSIKYHSAHVTNIFCPEFLYRKVYLYVDRVMKVDFVHIFIPSYTCRLIIAVMKQCDYF